MRSSEDWGKVLYFDPANADRPNLPADDLTSVLAQIDAQRTVAGAFNALLDYIPGDRFPYITVTKMAPEHEPIANAFPRSWGLEYLSEDYAGDDPVLALMVKLSKCFTWEDAHMNASYKEQRRVLEAAATHGLRDAYFIPFHGPLGWKAIITLGGPKGAAKMDPLQRLQIDAIAHATHVRIHSIKTPTKLYRMNAETQPLTPRERDCLRWVAKGKTDGEIAVILNIADSTVSFHVTNAMTKLDSSSRTQAAIKAVARGQLSLATVG